MGLLKEIPLTTGVTLQYWKIRKINIDRKEKTAEIYVDGFINQTVEKEVLTKELFIDNDNGVFSKYFIPEDTQFYDKNINEITYECLKNEIKFFRDSEDV